RCASSIMPPSNTSLPRNQPTAFSASPLPGHKKHYSSLRKAMRKALIIDDEPDIRELLTITLDGLGLQASQASNTREALEMIARNNYDLCLTDMCLPDGNGFDIVDAIQSLCPQTPVAVITAHG